MNDAYLSDLYLFHKRYAADDIIDLLQARASSGRAVFRLVDDMFEKLVVVLQRRFDIEYFDAELMLADLLREHENALYAALRDRIHLDDAEDAVRCCLGGGE